VSLATRCTACGTVFRVVQDQLRVSGGWVRCGRCSEVFNAVESLVDLELDRPADSAPPSVHGPRVMEDLARVARAPAPSPISVPRSVSAEAAASAPAEDTRVESAQTRPSSTAETADLPEQTEAPVEAADAAEVQVQAADGKLTRAKEQAAHSAQGVPTLTEMPSFVRQAERAARWRRPQVRAALVVLALLAAAALLWQVTLTHHDLMAARWPTARPLIERACVYGGCVIEPPRRIEALSVESSGLARAGPAGTYRLSMVLRNRESMTLRMPSVDLALTDAQGRTLARRVLGPAQLGAAQPSIPAGAELPLAVSLRARDPAVVGYTIEIFYP